MRKVNLGQGASAGIEDQLRWLTQAVRELERASAMPENTADVTYKPLGVLGVVDSGTVTPNPNDGRFQSYTNDGAHVLDPSTKLGEIILQIVNDAGAGAITVSGWDKVVGSFTTTNGHAFTCRLTTGPVGSLLEIVAMQ